MITMGAQCLSSPHLATGHTYVQTIGTRDRAILWSAVVDNVRRGAVGAMVQATLEDRSEHR